MEYPFFRTLRENYIFPLTLYTLNCKEIMKKLMILLKLIGSLMIFNLTKKNHKLKQFYITEKKKKSNVL